MYCPYCGKELLHKDGLFCSHCGKSLKSEETTALKEKQIDVPVVAEVPAVAVKNPPEKVNGFTDAIFVLLTFITLFIPIVGIISGIYSLASHKNATKAYILLFEGIGLYLLRYAFIFPLIFRAHTMMW